MALDVVQAFRGLLIQNSGVKALVDDRVYALAAPQGARAELMADGAAPRPYIVYRRTITVHNAALQGPTGKARTTITLDCYHRDYDSAVALGKAVRLAADGTRCTVTTSDGALLIQCGLETDEDDYIEPQDGSERGTFVQTQEYYVHHAEDTPA